MASPASITSTQLRVAAGAAKTLAKAELRLVFDASRPGSRPTEPQWDIFRDIGRVQYRFVIAGNQSGKSALAAREIAWILNDNHPLGWKRPAEWGTGPIKILIAGLDRRQQELELWASKLKPLLNDEWREVRTGQSLQHCENKRTGDLIIFVSHADSSERNQKHLQSFVVNVAWVDEMPASINILEEIMRRTDARNGFVLCTWTPKYKNAKLKKIVNSYSEPLGKVYRLSKLGNPVYAADVEKEMRKVAGYSKAYQDAVLYGIELESDDGIYAYDGDLHGGALPETYSRGWRHVCVVDPANNSSTGFTLWAEDPATSIWYLARSRYFEVSVPTELIRQIEAELVGYNVVSRRADSAAAWFRNQASAMGHKYMAVEDKQAGRKEDFIARAQECLGVRVRIPEFNTEMVDELCSYERNPETGQIVKAQKYHLIDCFHYFCHRIPAPDVAAVQQPWWTHLRQADEVRRQQEDRRHKRTDIRPVDPKTEIQVGDTSGNPLLRPPPGSRNSPASKQAEQQRRARHRRVWSRRA